MMDHRKLIGIIGFWPWMISVLRLDDAKEWLSRVYYCHHNARVLSDMEYRLGCVLTTCTRGMSKAYYTKEAMIAEIEDFLNETYNEGYEEGCRDTREEGLVA